MCVFFKLGKYIPEFYQCSDHSDGWLWAFFSSLLTLFLNFFYNKHVQFFQILHFLIIFKRRVFTSVQEVHQLLLFKNREIMTGLTIIL